MSLEILLWENETVVTWERTKGYSGGPEFSRPELDKYFNGTKKWKVPKYND